MNRLLIFSLRSAFGLVFSVVLSLGLGMAIPAFANEEAHGEHTAEHGHDYSGEYWKGGNLLVMIALLYILVGPTIRKTFADRTAQIAAELDAARDARQAAEKALVDANALLERASIEAEASREQAMRYAEHERDEMLARAKEEIAKIEANTALKMSVATETARQELRKFASALALELATESLTKKVDADFQDQLIGKIELSRN